MIRRCFDVCISKFKNFHKKNNFFYLSITTEIPFDYFKIIFEYVNTTIDIPNKPILL